jgi:hypothetical protein
MKKVDVCINVFGKPYQTLVTLKSLLEHSGDHIDKIFFIEESKQPKGYDFNIIKNNLKYKNMERYVPKYHFWVHKTETFKCNFDTDYRLSLRYQYGLEKTNKKHLLIIHNDVLFTGDVVSTLVSEIGDNFSIGNVGQCWNCPLNYEGICSGEKLNENLNNNIPYEDVINYVNKYPETRTYTQYRNNIDKINPLPMPECRINEWCQLVDVEKYKKEVIPNGEVVPLGGYYGMDIGDVWFKQMIGKGYNFKHFDINKVCKHGYFSEVGNGHTSLFNQKMYDEDEKRAEDYFYETF